MEMQNEIMEAARCRRNERQRICYHARKDSINRRRREQRHANLDARKDSINRRRREQCHANLDAARSQVLQNVSNPISSETAPIYDMLVSYGEPKQITYGARGSGKGLEALMQRFRNSVYQCNTQEYLPLKFSTPRNGIQCTKPEPVSSNQRIAPGKGIQCINPEPVFRRSSGNIKSKHVTVKVDREICITPKMAADDLQQTSIEDVRYSRQSTLEFKRYEKKDEQFDNIQGQLMTEEEEIKQVTREKNKISDDYHKTTKELICTKQMLKQKFNQLSDLQTKFEKLEAELQNEKAEKCKELDELKKLLQWKEIALNRFMNSTKVACDVDGSSHCSICMEPWTESGEHSICSLSCGHFFGRSCITKWINQATLALSTCPLCLQSASLGDLRQHYVQRICVCDEKKYVQIGIASHTP